MSRFILRSISVILLSILAAAAVAQDTLPYRNGMVSVVTTVRTQPGKFNEYYRYLAGPYSRIMDQAMKEGLVMTYAFFSATPASPDAPDLYIVETYPNMAVFDTLTEKMTAISSTVFGSLKQADEADANREEVRKILGTEILRQLVPVKTATATQ